MTSKQCACAIAAMFTLGACTTQDSSPPILTEEPIEQPGAIEEGAVNNSATGDAGAPDGDDVSGCTRGETSCSDGVATICLSVAGPRTIQCPGACNGEVCGGDSCEVPVVLTPVVNGAPEVLAGNRVSFSNTWDAGELADCISGVGTSSDQTPGPELFVRIDGVRSGQTVVFDAQNANGSYAFYVLDGCAATRCSGAYYQNEDRLLINEHPVDADGSILVVVEALGPDLDREFEILISVKE